MRTSWLPAGRLLDGHILGIRTVSFPWPRMGRERCLVGGFRARNFCCTRLNQDSQMRLDVELGVLDQCVQCDWDAPHLLQELGAVDSHPVAACLSQLIGGYVPRH